MTTVIADAAFRDGLLDVYARHTAHHLGEAAALLGAAIELSDGEASGSLRAAHQRLRCFVADLHDLDLDVDRSRWERLWLPQLVGDAAETVRASFASAHLEVVVPDGLPAVAGDRVPLIAALAHLLRFSASASRGASLRVELGAARAGDRVEVTLTDDQTVLGTEQPEQLFQPFGVAPGHDPLVGAGVGLIAARRIIAAHDGHIAAAPRPSHGVVMSFDLPAAP